MNRDYLKSKGYGYRNFDNLISRSGAWFSALTSEPTQNRQLIVESVPKNRRAFASQDAVLPFNCNQFGWPQNDISALLHATTDAEVNAILSRLNEVKAESKIPEGTSDEQIIRDYIVPRYVGSSSEALAYIERKYTTTITSDDLQMLDQKVEQSSVDEVKETASE